MRGYQKKVIFLKNTGTPIFDEAYFVISSFGECAEIEKSDMLLEANRIINESLEDSESRVKRERVKRKKAFLIPFFLGVLISSAIALIIYLFYIIFF